MQRLGGQCGVNSLIQSDECSDQNTLPASQDAASAGIPSCGRISARQSALQSRSGLHRASRCALQTLPREAPGRCI